mmetsp:Transcript_54049/g.156081  ORF Transcript_54049/g.156081 Transcript_54049/m.156081 type:complete len:203 (+) Transcript_54049:2323-2931(+)
MSFLRGAEHVLTSLDDAHIEELHVKVRYRAISIGVEEAESSPNTAQEDTSGEESLVLHTLPENGGNHPRQSRNACNACQPSQTSRPCQARQCGTFLIKNAGFLAQEPCVGENAQERNDVQDEYSSQDIRPGVSNVAQHLDEVQEEHTCVNDQKRKFHTLRSPQHHEVRAEQSIQGQEHEKGNEKRAVDDAFGSRTETYTQIR